MQGNVRAEDTIKNLNINSNAIIYEKNGKISLKEIQATYEDITINADEFEYDKILNVLIAKGNVRAEDAIKNLNINSNAIIYEKNDEKILSKIQKLLTRI